MAPETIHQIISFCPLFLSNVLFGLNIGWLAPVLKQSEDPNYEITLTPNQNSWVASLQEPLKAFGMICCVMTIDKLGRKTMLLVSSLFYLLGWALIRFTKSITLIYLSQSIFGFISGFIDSTMIVYLSENSSPHLRGVFTCLCSLAFFGGLVTEYALASYLSYNTVATVNFAVGIVQLLSLFVMKETVQFLIMRGRYEEAERNYRWIFSQDENEFEKLKVSITSSTAVSLSFKEFFSTPSFYKSISIAVSLTLLLYLTGFWTLLAYISTAFASSKILTPNEFTIFFGVIQLISSFGLSFVIERFNRRTILLSALFAGTLFHAISAALYYVHENLTPIPHFPWLIFTSITSFMVISSTGTMPISLVLRSELFPQKVKPLGAGLTCLAGSLGIFLSSIRFIQIANAFGIFADFLIFSTLCALTFVFAYLFVPETRGKSLHEIEHSFSKSYSRDKLYHL